ncbi:MAG: formate--phosphoribosylaminoimidazolecarboxamide ligase family protein [Candidatus Thermoplasmatota archaeon]|nr:formate--phosphoribosylaminoimidazolecarboxamide ligase family protein [Candidatus Thermoplasmatota archaeon]
MLDRKEIWEIVEGYEMDKAKIGVIASHSALDVCDGAAEEGFPTVAVCKDGRHKTYAEHFLAQRKNGNIIRGCVDDPWIFPSFKNVMEPHNQNMLREKNVFFVPNRSFTSYVKVSEIENNFRVPMVGSRNMLRMEERGEAQDYYWILERAGLPFPEKIESPSDISELSIVKLHHAQKKLERGFFTASSYKEYREKSEALISQGVITSEALKDARIERYVIGPVFNLDFFYSPIEKEMSKLELIGVDWRFESSLDGHVRLPAPQQMSLNEKQMTPEYTVCGHNSATLRESLLENAISLGEKFVEAAKEHYSPGIIGAFCLQTCVDKDLKFYIYDVAPRVGGGTNVHMSVGHPYGNTIWRKPMSTGRRTAMELRRAIEMDKVKEIVT